MSHRPNRQLAAIMFADMVGYTALMQRDEATAMRQRLRYRRALDRAVSAYGGHTVQHYGDGALTIFRSAIEAVQCAVDMQRDLLEEPRVDVRIGLHTGDIVHDDEGVYGDGVNLASRIQSIAVPGSVFVSDKLFDELKNQRGLQAVALGQFALKNVHRRVGVWAVDAPGITVPGPGSVSGAEPPSRHSVAVLPFVNMSSDPENEFFSDGISEEIINALTRVRGLKVTSRTSSFAFKGRSVDVREIAESLGVSTVLEGSVRKAGGRVRVTAQLISAADGYHLFSETYDRSLEDIFAIQDQIAAEIVRGLRATMAQAATEKAASEGVAAVSTGMRPLTPKVDVDAYTAVLKARHLVNQWSPEAAQRAVELYREASELDPSYAAARIGLATTYTFLGALGRLGSRDAYRQARLEAERGSELDPSSEEAQVALGLVALFDAWDGRKALRYLDRALELNPGSAWVHHTRALYYQLLLDQERAMVEIREALRLDPLSQPINREMAQILILAGRYEEAWKQLDHTLELGPAFRSAIESKGFIAARLGRLQEAVELFRRYASYSPSPHAGATHLGYVYGLMGDMERARAQLERLEARAQAQPDILLEMDFAIVHLGMGDIDTAFEWAKRGVAVHLSGMIFALVSPIWGAVRRDPRFMELTDRIGLWRGVEARWRYLADR